MKHKRIKFLLILTSPETPADVKAFSSLEKLAEYVGSCGLDVTHLESLTNPAVTEMHFTKKDSEMSFDIVKVRSIQHDPKP